MREDVNGICGGAARDWLREQMEVEWSKVNKSINLLFPNEQAFKTVKTQGVGQTTILKFLGGDWKGWDWLREQMRGEWGALNKSIKCLFDDEFSFQNTKGSVGQTIILKFLGGDWKDWDWLWETGI
jgi:hypothetical protein